MREIHSDELYIGVDLGTESAMLSYFHFGMERPATISFITGSGDYKLPMVMAKRKGMGSWVYGKEALRMEREGKGTAVNLLYQRALKGESLEIEGRNYKTQELFLLFLKKILSIPNKLDRQRKISYLVVAVKNVTEADIVLLGQVREGLELEKDQFEVVDYKECFYFYSCNQEESLQNHRVGLFGGNGREITYLELEKDRQKKPVVVEVGEEKLGVLGMEKKDEMFLQMAEKVLAKKIFSAVYFVGETFDGQWMSESLKYICRGRRAFLGKNLYSLGACFAAFQKNSKSWKYIYLGDSAFKMNISLKVKWKNELEFYSLVTAGENWYHKKHSCDVILDDTNVIELWLQHPYGREAKIENLEIADLPRRPNRTTRIRIGLELLSDTQVRITLQDMGFGEFYSSSGKSWNYTMEF